MLFGFRNQRQLEEEEEQKTTKKSSMSQTFFDIVADPSNGIAVGYYYANRRRQEKVCVCTFLLASSNPTEYLSLVQFRSLVNSSQSTLVSVYNTAGPSPLDVSYATSYRFKLPVESSQLVSSCTSSSGMLIACRFPDDCVIPQDTRNCKSVLGINNNNC